jgi:hypothetical protein
VTPVLEKMLSRCVFAVVAAMFSSSAVSPNLRPVNRLESLDT